MSYSFITPVPKPVFSLFSKLWLGFIGLVVILMVIFDLFVVFKINTFNSEVVTMDHSRVSLEKQIDSHDARVGAILRQKGVAEEIYASNTVLKDSMKNLFDLVPDQITLSRVIMEKNSLIMYGKTPSKDTYNFLLASPLRSIFHTSSTIFYLNDEGWYRFVSTNKIINSDGFNE